MTRENICGREFSRPDSTLRALHYRGFFTRGGYNRIIVSDYPIRIPRYRALRFGAAVFIASAVVGYITGGAGAIMFCAMIVAEATRYWKTGQFADLGWMAVTNFGYSLAILLSSGLSHAAGELLLAARDMAQNSFRRDLGSKISN